MKNSTIRAKLIIAFSVLMTLLLVLSAVMLHKLSEANDRVDQMVGLYARKVNLSNELTIDVLEFARNEKNIILETNPIEKNDYRKKLIALANDIDLKTTELKSLVDKDGLVLLSSFEKSWANYSKSVEEVIQLSIAGETEKAFDLSSSGGSADRNFSLEQLNLLAEKNQRQMNIAKEVNTSDYDAAKGLLILLIAVSLLAIVISLLWIIRSIASRIQSVTREAIKIASREHFSEQVNNHVSDELKPVFDSLTSIHESFREVATQANRVSNGDLEASISLKSDQDTLGIALNKMTLSLLENTSKNEKTAWLSSGKNNLNEIIIGDLSMTELASRTIRFVSEYTGSSLGAIYILNDASQKYELAGSYSWPEGADQLTEFKAGQGLIGQVAQTQKSVQLSQIPEEGLRIQSSVVHMNPLDVIISPLTFEGRTVGVVEVAKLTSFNETEQEFIAAAAEIVGIAINSSHAKEKINQLLNESNLRGLQLANAKHEIEQQLEGLNAVALVSIADPEGNITYVNDRFISVSKYENDELIGHNHRMLKSGKQPDGLFVGMWKAISSGRVWNGEIVNKAKDGSFYWVDTTIIPILNLEGKLERYLSVRFEITKIKEQQELLKGLNEELQSQQEELKQMNEELEEQAQNLKQQQEELQMTNEELEEQTQALESRNKEVENARVEIERKSEQLEVSSRYKSEFLANMSHELRTPLNSLLILSKDLSENKNKNLTEEQVESAEIIYKSGRDLLTLINEVLDLSKIEAGKMDVNVEKIELNNLINSILKDFRAQASQKGLALKSILADGIPPYIKSDQQRLNQILRNLLSNAIKFTEQGHIEIRVSPGSAGRIIISVEDTGIGIPPEKQDAIFEAFQQADGGTSRKYGGTGLGLSISRELARILGGKISLTSEFGKGSVFSLDLPVEVESTRDINVKQRETAYSLMNDSRVIHNTETYLNYPSVPDDRESIKPNDKVVLLIEDDMVFAAVLMKQAHEKGFKCLAASTGEDGVNLAFQYKPAAIILDLDLPGMSGHDVLSKLKNSPQVRHIPVHIMSVNERSLQPIKSGAVEYLVKPVEKKDLDQAFNRIEMFVDRKMKNLLIVEDDKNSRKAIMTLIGNGDVKCFEAESGKEALNIFDSNQVDCIVLDLGLPDMSGFEFIQKLEDVTNGELPPIVVYTGRELSRDESTELQRYAESIIIKGVKSEERLLDETALFLHRTVSKLPANKQKIISQLYDPEAIFHGKKILLTDDDMRNVFALSKILKDKGMQIVRAENGKRALEALSATSDIDLVLMDIMMPEMDGYEAMRKIRSELGMTSIPIIALTAKAMKDDKHKCIEAGANDYITKPVDVEKLLSLMRVWLTK